MTTQAVQLLGDLGATGSGHSPVEIAQQVRRGLPWSCFESVGAALALPARDLAEMLHIPLRTLDRRKVAGRLEATESDRLFRVARIVAHAIDVFGSVAKARDWLASENRSLDHHKPLQLLDTDAGAQEVDEVLGRIEHGIFG